MAVPVRLGLLGAGRIGQMHAELLARRVPGARLVVVQDAVPEVASRVAADLDVAVATSVDEVLAADVDAIAVCTSTDTHADLIERAAGAGKHVFSEKPISLDLDEVDRVIAAVDEAGVKLQVGFNRRFDSSHRAVRDRVAAGAVGTPTVVRITSRDPAPPGLEYIRRSGGLFLDMTIHDFDMAGFLVGQRVTEVAAAGAALVDPAIGGAGDIDTALLTLRYESGALAVIDNCRRSGFGYDQRVEVLGTAGQVRSDNHRSNHAVLETSDGASLAAVPTFFVERYLDSFVAQWEAFVDVVRTDRMPEVDGRAARVPLILGLAAGASLRAGGCPVKVADVAAEAA
ncbi:inositol 2-dehydrogenase [Nitriliruptor alkaliphilus]|uniref:inositol 2-dehydrogenase n=1 Tax=Nitriliruptor alkaliphilus TaxID=427918 RepID=UPI000698337F|nr:inositol 2-dehydrogenase [Nitriliruptor alkaliphilus]